MYIGQKEIKDIVQYEFSDGAKHHQVAVEYTDGTSEIMHEDEYNATKSETPVSDRNDLFVKATAPLQKKILEAISEHNVRFDDIGRTFDWVTERLNMNKDAALSAVLGVKDWKVEAKVSTLKNIDVEKLGETEKKILETVSDTSLLDAIIGTPWRNVLEAIKQALDKSLEEAMAHPLQEVRVDDINRLAEITYAIQNQENTADVGSEGHLGQDVGGGKNSDQSQGSPVAETGQTV